MQSLLQFYQFDRFADLDFKSFENEQLVINLRQKKPWGYFDGKVHACVGRYQHKERIFERFHLS